MEPPRIFSSERQPVDQGAVSQGEQRPSTSCTKPGLLDLPPELIKIIFMYLDCHDRAQLSQVCPALSNIYFANVESIPCINGHRAHYTYCGFPHRPIIDWYFEESINKYLKEDYEPCYGDCDGEHSGSITKYTCQIG